MIRSATEDNPEDKFWIALSVGNSRLHWAGFKGEVLQQSWDTPHLSTTEINSLISNPDLVQKTLSSALLHYFAVTGPEVWVASVVPGQADLWQAYPGIKIITLEQVPLQKVYPTLGVDRALALWGAGQAHGWPSLVIDAGTALTFTGADATCNLVGGAILPGLGLQVRSLAAGTAALPLIELPEQLPQRWAVSTGEAIQSGTVYTTLAGVCDFVQAWWQTYPDSWIVLTGGDSTTLYNYLKTWAARQRRAPEWMARLIQDPYLVFGGIQSLRQNFISRVEGT